MDELEFEWRGQQFEQEARGRLRVTCALDQLNLAITFDMLVANLGLAGMTIITQENIMLLDDMVFEWSGGRTQG